VIRTEACLPPRYAANTAPVSAAIRRLSPTKAHGNPPWQNPNHLRPSRKADQLGFEEGQESLPRPPLFLRPRLVSRCEASLPRLGSVSTVARVVDTDFYAARSRVSPSRGDREVRREKPLGNQPGTQGAWPSVLAVSRANGWLLGMRQEQVGTHIRQHIKPSTTYKYACSPRMRRDSLRGEPT